MTYMDVFAAGYVIPIVEVKLPIQILAPCGRPCHHRDPIHQHPAAKIKFEYAIYKEPEHILAATGNSMQVFMRKDTNELELSTPISILTGKRNGTYWTNSVFAAGDNIISSLGINTAENMENILAERADWMMDDKEPLPGAFFGFAYRLCHASRRSRCSTS